MKRKEKIKLIKTLKTKYKDHEQIIDKKKRDIVRFNLGEIDIPAGFDKNGCYLSVDHIEGKHYLVARFILGKNPEIKEKERQERQKLKEVEKKAREKIKAEIRQINQKIKSAIKANLKEEILRLVTEKEELEEKLESKNFGNIAD